MTCFGDADGEIYGIGSSGGAPPYEYSLNGGTFQSSNAFTGQVAGTYTLTIRDDDGCTTTLSGLTITEPPVLSGADSLIMVTCNGDDNGEIHVIGSTGGTPGYTYSTDGISFGPSPSFTGLAPGTYTVTQMDANGCTNTLSSLAISEPTPLSASDSAINVVSCLLNDGELYVTGATGGIGPYEYSIDGITYGPSNAFTGLPTGSYTLYTRDQNGCIHTILSNITSPSGLTASSVTVDATCNASTDGEITISGTGGGTAPYQYDIGSGFQVSNTFSGLSAGVYNVTVQDAGGCEFILSAITITEPASISTSPTLTDISCNGAGDGIIAVSGTIGGTSPYMYSIDGSTYGPGTTFSGLAPGTYSIYLQDVNGCTDTLFGLSLTEPAVLSATNTVSEVTCNGFTDGEISVTSPAGGTAPYEYSLDGITFQPSSLFTGLSGGTETITVRDANGCLLTLPGILINEPALISFSDSVAHISCNGLTDGEIFAIDTLAECLPTNTV